MLRMFCIFLSFLVKRIGGEKGNQLDVALDFTYDPFLHLSIILDWPIALVKGAEESSSIIIHLLDPFDPSFNEVDVLVNYCTMCVYERASRACLTQKRGWCEASNASCLYFKSNLAQRQVDPPFSPPTLFTRNDKNIQNMVLQTRASLLKY